MVDLDGLRALHIRKITEGMQSLCGGQVIGDAFDVNLCKYNYLPGLQCLANLRELPARSLCL